MISTLLTKLCCSIPHFSCPPISVVVLALCRHLVGQHHRHQPGHCHHHWGDGDEEVHKQACLPKTTLEIIAAGDSGVHWFTKGHSPLYILEHPRRRVLGQGLFLPFCTARDQAGLFLPLLWEAMRKTCM